MSKFTFRSELDYRTNANGLHAILVRITQKREKEDKLVVRRVSTGYSIKKTEWNPKSREIQKGGGVRASNPHAGLYNKEINELILKGENYIANFKDAKIEEVQSFLKGEEIIEPHKKCFYEYCEDLTKRNPKKWGVAFFDKMGYLVTQMKQIAPEKLLFEDFNKDFLQKLDILLAKKNGNSTINKKIDMLRIIVNVAIWEDIMPETYNPFKKIISRVEQPTQKVFLTEQQILRLEQLELNPKSKMYDSRNFFLTQFYISGKRVSDILLMKFSDITDESMKSLEEDAWQNIDKITARYTHKIYKGRDRKPKIHSAILTEEAKKIIKYYYENKKTKYVFPFLADDYEKLDERQLKKQLESKTTQINNNLEKISEIYGFPKFRTHTARRSFAQLAKKYHDNKIDIQDAMGHEDFETTTGYFDKSDFSGVDRVTDAVSSKRQKGIITVTLQ
jgi:integrase/recombinase XerD